MSTIKPIQTIYKGYRFRSRLEARWAVFFPTGIDLAKMQAFDNNPPEDIMGLIYLVGMPEPPIVQTEEDTGFVDWMNGSTWHVCQRCDIHPVTDIEHIKQACAKAKQARFEHGECPQ